jgi:hypothetical protein
MSHSSQTERRQEARFPQSFGVALRELPRIGSADSAETKTISGRALNLSDTGLCLVTSAPVGRFSLVRCEIEIGNPRRRLQLSCRSDGFMPLHPLTIVSCRACKLFYKTAYSPGVEELSYK